MYVWCFENALNKKQSTCYSEPILTTSFFIAKNIDISNNDNIKKYE